MSDGSNIDMDTAAPTFISNLKGLSCGIKVVPALMSGISSYLKRNRMDTAKLDSCKVLLVNLATVVGHLTRADNSMWSDAKQAKSVKDFMQRTGTNTIIMPSNHGAVPSTPGASDAEALLLISDRIQDIALFISYCLASCREAQCVEINSAFNNTMAVFGATLEAHPLVNYSSLKAHSSTFEVSDDAGYPLFLVMLALNRFSDETLEVPEFAVPFVTSTFPPGRHSTTYGLVEMGDCRVFMLSDMII
jgi:hypothetical protein